MEICQNILHFYKVIRFPLIYLFGYYKIGKERMEMFLTKVELSSSSVTFLLRASKTERPPYWFVYASLESGEGDMRHLENMVQYQYN